MELKFDPKYKSAVFRAKYLNIKIEFENLTCYVFAVFFPPFRASGGRFGRFSV